MKSKLLVCVAGVVVAALALIAASPEKKADSTEAARLNNLGCAYMNQQLFEKALKYFEDASAADPNLTVAKVNQGIALLGLARIDQAKAVLDEAAKESPKDPHVWYALGMLEKNSSDPQAAVDAFKRVIEIDDSDADTWYFLGTVYAQLKQFPQAIDAFEHAIKLNPLHASAQFGLSRAYQQSGNTPAAREHLTRFQYITQHKLGSAMSLAYGDQGKYSLAEESPAAAEKVPAQIPVKFVDVTKEAGLPTSSATGELEFFHGPGACFLDYDNDGLLDLFLADYGAQGGTSLYHNVGRGKFEDVTVNAGLDPKSRAVACAPGDYDNDGYVDLALGFIGHITLFHNEKNGTFKTAGEHLPVKPNKSMRTVAWIDYDHDGDIDLFLGSYAKGQYEGAPVGDELWRNNGDGSFSDVTEEKGFAGQQLHATAVGTDYNNDRAVDIFVAGLDPVMFQNPREGKFIARQPWGEKLMQCN